MIDRELLELAAKAAGITLEYRRGSDAYYYDDPETGREEWRPHLDDGQALRLAVKCLPFYTLHYSREDWEECCEDGYAATRRAIVRAAAEIALALDNQTT